MNEIFIAVARDGSSGPYVIDVKKGVQRKICTLARKSGKSHDNVISSAILFALENTEFPDFVVRD